MKKNIIFHFLKKYQKKKGPKTYIIALDFFFIYYYYF
jgi:hypothetical protein